jgi:DNA-binding NtrC family response regulator
MSQGERPIRGSTDVHAVSRHAAEDGAVRGVPRITATAGPGVGRSFAMTGALATAGRHATNDLVLVDPRVSAVHLEMRRHGERVHVRDAGSTNGTWLGPHRVVEVELAQGGEIVVGDTRLRVDIDGGAETAALSPDDVFGELVGESSAMRELFATLGRIAPKNIGLLIQGETGTGKEEVARALHARSPRADKPFVVIDATSLPETLAESLLFGHEKGAFTGATDRRVGLFEAAHGGTVFLDEIGELPPALQAKFLRVLERQEFSRVGGNAGVKVDVRVIAATHRDLRNEIESGRFREDLYFRLAQLRVSIPPLRDRLEDIPILCRKLLAAIAADREIMIEQSAMTHLAAQPWPGNVRELRNVLARAAALCTDGIIRRTDVAGEGYGFRGTPEERTALDLSGKFAPAKEHAVQRFESAYLAALMKRCGGNLSKAAREADLARHHLRDLLKKRGLYGVAWGDGGDNGDRE